MSTFFGTSFLKYGVTGLVGMALDFFVTWVCKEKLSLNKYFSNSLGFSIAVVNNFLLNRYWTFENTTHPFTWQLTKFVLVSVAGLLINNLLLYLLLKNARSNFYFLKLVVIALVFCWNYFGNFLFTFNKQF